MASSDKISRPLVPLQSEPAECAVVAICALTALHGKPLSGTAIKEQFGLSTRGVSISQILTILRAAGFDARAAIIAKKAFHKINLPAIALWRANHFVVLSKIKGDYVEIYDPEFGWDDSDVESLQNNLTGPIVEITSVPEVPKIALRVPLDLKAWLLRYKQVKAFVPIIVFSLIAQLLTLGLPLVAKNLLDHATGTGSINSLLKMAIIYSLVGVVGLVARSAAQRVATKISARLTGILTDDVASRLLQKPLAYFSRHVPAVLVGKIQTANLLQLFFIQFTSTTLIQGAMSVVATGALFLISPIVATLVAVGAGLAILADSIFKRRISATSERFYRANVDQQSALLELCKAAQAIKLNHAAREMLDRLGKKNEKLCDSSTRYELAKRLRFDAQGALELAEYTLYLGLGAWLVSEHRITFGGFVALGLYRDIAVSGLKEIQNMVVDLFKLRVSLGRLEDIVDPKSEKPNHERKAKRELSNADFEVEHLDFSYSKFDKPVLEDFSLSVRDGEHVAIVGPSGSGKSTLARLLVGALQPSSGRIRIGGIDLTTETEEELLCNIGSVMQSDQLITASIKENIDFYRGYSDAEIEQAAKMAEMADFINSLPMRYETPISDEFAGLSGGQRQRILIARALCGSPRILVMDEATSYLDTGTEKLIAERIAAMNITRIIFAHREETIRRCDRIVSIIREPEVA